MGQGLMVCILEPWFDLWPFQFPGAPALLIVVSGILRPEQRCVLGLSLNCLTQLAEYCQMAREPPEYCF